MPIVIPAQAGIQEATAGLHLGTLDSRLRGNDGEQLAVNGYESGTGTQAHVKAHGLRGRPVSRSATATYPGLLAFNNELPALAGAQVGVHKLEGPLARLFVLAGVQRGRRIRKEPP